MKKADAVKLITMTQTIWPNWAAALDSEDKFALAVESWAVILDEVSLELAIAALHSLATDGREFAPQPGLIRRRAIDLRMRADGSAPPSVDEAWTEVQEAVRAFGFQSPPYHWDHPAVERAVAAIGWKELCHGTNPEATRAHFMRLYGTITAHWERDAHTPPSVAAAAQKAALEGPTTQRELPRIGLALD